MYPLVEVSFIIDNISFEEISYPSATKTAPVIKLLIGDARKTIQSTISSTLPSRFIGVLAISPSILPSFVAACKRGVSTYPGQIALIRIPCWANVFASYQNVGDVKSNSYRTLTYSLSEPNDCVLRCRVCSRRLRRRYTDCSVHRCHVDNGPPSTSRMDDSK